jgi:hypothetical protein
MNWNLVGSMYGRSSSMEIAHFVLIRHRQYLFLIGRFLKHIFLLNRLAKWTETWYEASMEGPLSRMLISFQSDYKYDPPQAIIFSHWSISNKSFPLNRLDKWIETW